LSFIADGVLLYMHSIDAAYLFVYVSESFSLPLSITAGTLLAVSLNTWVLTRLALYEKSPSSYCFLPSEGKYEAKCSS